MVCQFLLYNRVNQLYIYIYPHISSLLRLPPTLPIPPLQEDTKHLADLPVLCGCFPQLSILHLVVYICPQHTFFFKIYLSLLCWVFVAAHGLSLVAASGGYCFVAVRRLLIVVASRCRAWALGVRASVVVACGLSSCGSRALERRLSSCGARAQLLHGMWDLPGPGLEPVSPALAGGFLTTAPPGKSHNIHFCLNQSPELFSVLPF